jgi:thiol-disulfide isomerase/thioredoxin
MYKQLFFLFVLLLVSLFVTAQNNRYTIEGEISQDFNDKRIMLFIFDNHQISNIDTTLVKDGKFYFYGDENLVEEAIVTTGNYPDVVKSTKLILEKGKIQVDMEDSPIVTGTCFNNLIKAYRDSFSIFTTQIHETWKLHESGKASDQDLTTLYEQLDKYNYHFKKSNIHNIAGKIAIKEGLYDGTDSHFDEYYEMADETLKADEDIIKYLKKREIEIQKEQIHEKLINQTFIDFELETPTGEKRKISDFVSKNDYLYVDFWASWCAPCIAEIPKLKKIAEKYKKLDVIYISLDHKKEDWINAINKHEIEWPNLSDLHGMPSDLSNTYSIPGIPFGLLINKEGIIVTTVYGVHVLDFILDKIAK